MNDKQKEMVLTAIDSHIGVLYKHEEAYHRNGDTDMVKEIMILEREYPLL